MFEQSFKNIDNILYSIKNNSIMGNCNFSNKRKWQIMARIMGKLKYKITNPF